MRIIYLFGSILICFNLFSQTSIKFSYDAGGNMTQRYIQSVSLRLGQTPAPKDSVLSFNIYPNPTRDQITIEGKLEKQTEAARIQLYNVNGSIVTTDTYYGVKKTISLNGLTPGIYFLEVKYSKNQSSNYHIIITE